MKITPEKTPQETSSENNKLLPTDCRMTQERLSSFLDNEISGLQATQVVTHLKECALCQDERRRLSELRKVLRTMPQKSDREADAARGRVMARVESAGLHKRSASARSLSGQRWPAVRPLAATFAAAVALTLAALILPRPGGGTLIKTPFSRTIVSVALPDVQEMTTLSHLHDAHGATMAFDEPVARRDMSAAAHADLLEISEATVAGSL